MHHHFRCSIMLLSFTLLLACKSKPEDPEQRKDALFAKDYKTVLGEIDSMSQADQQIRNLMCYGTDDRNKIDSVNARYAALGVNIDSVLQSNDTFFVSRAFVDSVTALMAQQDERHTLAMIALIHQYGYPESDRVDTSLHISPFVLMHHPDVKYKDTMLTLLSNELKHGRIDTVSYEMIRWDYNGRQGLPEIPGMKVHQNEDGTTTIQL